MYNKAQKYKQPFAFSSGAFRDFLILISTRVIQLAAMQCSLQNVMKKKVQTADTTGGPNRNRPDKFMERKWSKFGSVGRKQAARGDRHQSWALAVKFAAGSSARL